MIAPNPDPARRRAAGVIEPSMSSNRSRGRAVVPQAAQAGASDRAAECFFAFARMGYSPQSLGRPPNSA